MEGLKTIRRLIVLAMLAVTLVSMASAANYMYEKASVKGFHPCGASAELSL